MRATNNSSDVTRLSALSAKTSAHGPIDPPGDMRRGSDRLSKSDTNDLHEIAACQIDILNSYYSLILAQARKCFRWALLIAGIGALFFLGAIGSLLLGTSTAIPSLISGAILEIVSGIVFYFYGKTAGELSILHDRLDQMLRVLLANSLCESLNGDEQQKTRTELIKSVAMYHQRHQGRRAH